MKKGLVILHVDGVSYALLQRALKKGYMPHLSSFISSQKYTLQRYRCGLPSTTPYCQAGILYGDSSNIPAFRWWDKQEDMLITFGRISTFKHVAKKYFKKNHPLLQNGACFASCFSAGASEAFSLIYKEKVSLHSNQFHLTLLLRWIQQPWHVIDWLLTSILFLFKALISFLVAFSKGSHISLKYFMGDIFNELFVHHLTRFAVRSAMGRGFPIIFAGFYTYDEVAHAFGPEDPFSYYTLSQLDKSIKYITRRNIVNNCSYDFVILSDHGTISTIPFTKHAGEHLADKIANVLPQYTIEEVPGKTIQPDCIAVGHIMLVYSGQLAHVYFRHIPSRLSYKKIQKLYPGLLDALAQIPEIAFVLVKDRGDDVILSSKGVMSINHKALNQKTRQFLEQFDQADILAKQLHVFNSSQTAGDIILFGAYKKNSQISFENQTGSHSALGGEQMFPFILSKTEWHIDAEDIYFSSQIYEILSELKRKLGIEI